ncbi:class I SAM-dependent methyltransferase [Novosphingobium olei]|uniref:Class I SAM-dependent methyltransferase n=1 Tax=Novosphingobium olei TaxID=2728851 RepID=A0A7Y0GBV9_9SPHN|nr:class I SAM-dependent methyltransferase [Novosphingobium olei]NML95379.1 class I SAM-dependent methyltransferase [Novosphingobium olei]BEU98988.1 class I SAM-dependent methyltransferase [Novosphingobium olei]
MDQPPGRRAADLFEDLLPSCGATDQPGVVVLDEWHVWSLHPTTEDQLRIERYLDGFPMRGKRILHVGAGNSLLAKRFCARGAEVVGTTITREEVTHGRSLAIPRYDVRLHNKYLGADGLEWGQFDFIVDNNPTTFACCLDHYMAMLRFYADVLKPDGQWLVDRVGLGWVASDDMSPRWRFSLDDLARSAALVGLQAAAMTDDVIAVSAKPPRKPSAARRIAMRLLDKLRR